MDARSWTEQEIRTLIFNEVTQGSTGQSLNESVRLLVDETRAGFVETMKSFEKIAGQITVLERETKKASDEIARILGDCQTYVARVEIEQNEARAKLALELESSHTQQQAIVKFIETLQPQVADLKVQMTAVNEWFKDTAAGQAAQRAGEIEKQVQTFDSRVHVFERDIERDIYQLNQSLEAKLGALNAPSFACAGYLASGPFPSAGNFGTGSGK